MFFAKTHSVFNWQQKTKGVLDLGGASTQIVFVPTSKIIFKNYPKKKIETLFL